MEILVLSFIWLFLTHGYKKIGKGDLWKQYILSFHFSSSVNRGVHLKWRSLANVYLVTVVNISKRIHLRVWSSQLSIFLTCCDQRVISMTFFMSYCILFDVLLLFGWWRPQHDQDTCFKQKCRLIFDVQSARNMESFQVVVAIIVALLIVLGRNGETFLAHVSHEKHRGLKTF